MCGQLEGARGDEVVEPDRVERESDAPDGLKPARDAEEKKHKMHFYFCQHLSL